MDCGENPLITKQELSSRPDAMTYDMCQGYLDKNCRIRSVTHDSDHIDYWFTYKMKINGEQIEIEKTIDKADFDKLWTRVGQIITKTRIVIPHDSLKWEVDFFFSNRKQTTGSCYLVMAEVEMPAGQETPEVIPDFVLEKLIYAVPREDRRFMSKNLTKPNAVIKLVELVTNV